MTLKDFTAIVETDAKWIREWCKPLRLAINKATGSPVFLIYESEDKKHWTAVLYLRGDKTNDKGEIWHYSEGFCSADDYPRYQYLRNRMIERYRECAATGVWQPLIGEQR